MGIEHFAILIPGNYASDDPYTGLEATLQLFELAEELGYGSAWVRQRHLETGVSSAATFLAAASQRTRRIGLGSAVIQLGYENPFRLAEDLATVDVLSRGRVNVGVSAGPAPFAELLGDLLPQPAAGDHKFAQAERLQRAIRAAPLSDEKLSGNAAGDQTPRRHPIAAGLDQRLWYGGGSSASARWAGSQGWNLLTGNVITAEGSDDFLTTQTQLIATWRQHLGAQKARVGLGRVILPTDNADADTKARYLAFRDARLARTRQPNGPKRMMFLPDLVGSTDEILSALRQDPVLPLVKDLRVELPYEFSTENYAQILKDCAKLFAALR